MINDYLDIENAEGFANLADSTIALDLLLTAKNGVRNYAIALTEVATPEVKALLHSQLELAIASHEAISKLMISKGWLHPYDTDEQFHLDAKSSKTALKLAALPLFPDDTNRLGTFATPFK